MKTVCIMMSTYNGQLYLKEQLDSLLCQSGVEVQILVRDDGSSDETIAILKKYAALNSNIILLLEKNLGCEPSFDRLIQYASTYTDCDYYAYCDQDDVWFPEKLLKSISTIEKEKGPSMYCSNQIITDNKLQPLGMMIKEEEYEKTIIRFNNNYFLNRHGCTMVWNKALQEILGSIKHEKHITPPHDTWAMLIAQCAGKVIVGKEPLMYYRIHSLNTGGLETNKIKRFKKGFRLYLKRDGHRADLAKECLCLLDKSSKQGEGPEFVRKVASYKCCFWDRIKLICSKQIRQYGGADGIVYAMSILLGKY